MAWLFQIPDRFSLSKLLTNIHLDILFAEIYIPKGGWEELTRDKTTDHFKKIEVFFKKESGRFQPY